MVKDANYHMVKGVLERAKMRSETFNDTELRTVFRAKPETIKRLREDEKVKVEHKEPEIKLSDKQIKHSLKQAFEGIVKILKKYCDLKTEYYTIIALWILGTYMHDEFNTYPFLFINAMRGSGKTRLLKLIAKLSKNGKVMADMSEAVLFRTAKGSTLCIDEFESIGGKEKGTLRELLNAAYKKGITVERMRKNSGKDGEKYEVEKFDLYTSIAMANIFGMEEVLEDRCISLILEKSNDTITTRLIEDFDDNDTISVVLEAISRVSVVWCRLIAIKNIATFWNDFLESTNNTNDTTTHTTITTHNNTTTLTKMFKKIYDMGINGREIELFWALFVIAEAISPSLLDEVLLITKDMVKLKKSEQFTESRDITLYDFVSKQHSSIEFIPLLDITRAFKEFVGVVEDDDRWVNNRWLGRALKRLNLILHKRRVARGREVILNIDKAKEKIKYFKEVEDDSK